MTELLQSISKMIVNGNRLELPKDEMFANYTQVKKCLMDAGGKYKRSGFDFTESGELIKTRLLGGEAINDKKKYQFFPTPKPVVDRMLSKVDFSKLHDDSRFLEPSAGQGHIVDAVAEIISDVSIEFVLVELMPQNCQVLQRKGYFVYEADFLTLNPVNLGGEFDLIIANPPFTKNQDIDHIRHMYEFLAEDGQLVTLSSTSWKHGSQKKQIAFCEWLDEIGAEVEEVPEGEFKESGTNIATLMIKIVKGE